MLIAGLFFTSFTINKVFALDVLQPYYISHQNVRVSPHNGTYRYGCHDFKVKTIYEPKRNEILNARNEDNTERYLTNIACSADIKSECVLPN